tara:strand:+ start:968 stop:1510 length:543 start_codon:yes stop_codon:yes gene_type:complete
LKINNNFIPFIIFFSGLSASGKTTISRKFLKKIKSKGISRIINIDGDDFRKKKNSFIFKKTDRNTVGDKKIALAKRYFKKGFIVVVSGIAADSKWRKRIKKNNKDFFEIYVKCPLKICEKRDFKKQYKMAREGKIKNFVGIDLKYEIGQSHDLTLNSSRLTITKSVSKVINFLKKKKYVF